MKKLLFLILATAFFFPGVSQAQEIPKVKVITKTVEPFVLADVDKGFSIDLLKALFQKMGGLYETSRGKSVSELINKVESNEADMAIAAITINAAREERVDFSQPMFSSGLQIMVPHKNQRIDFEFSMLFPLLKVIGIICLIMVISAHLVWLSERKSNPDFDKNYLQGVWDGFWWSAVTVTTVGYGDKAPKRPLGKIVGLIWMFASLFVIAYFTSSITSTLTLQSLRGSINGPADLVGKSVATVEGTTSESYLELLKINSTPYPTIDEAYAALQDGTAEAVVYDAPVLQYYATNQGQGKVKVVGKPFRKEFYGIAVAKGSPLLKKVNVALLSLMEDGTYANIHEKWFGSRE